MISVSNESVLNFNQFSNIFLKNVDDLKTRESLSSFHLKKKILPKLKLAIDSYNEKVEDIRDTNCLVDSDGAILWDEIKNATGEVVSRLPKQSPALLKKSKDELKALIKVLIQLEVEKIDFEKFSIQEKSVIEPFLKIEENYILLEQFIYNLPVYNNIFLAENLQREETN